MKKDLLFAYLLEVPIVIILLFWHFSIGLWIVMIILLAIAPLTALRKPIIQSFGIPNNMPATKLILIELCLITFVSLGYFVGHDSYIEIATTDDVKKANEIENIMSDLNHSTIRFVSGVNYTIAIQNANKKDYKLAVLSLVYDDIITKNVNIHLNKSSRNYGKKTDISNFINVYNRELPYLINGIAGVYNSTVNVKLQDSVSKSNVIVNVKIDTDESFDTEEIESLTDKLLLSSITGLTKDDISIDFNIQPCSSQDKCYNYQTTRRLYRKAKDYYK